MNDFQKYVSQNKDRAKEVGPGVYRIPLIQEELTPSFKLNSPYMQGAESGGLYAFVDSTGNIIPNQDIEYDPSDNQYYKVHHLPDAKVEAPSLSAYNDPNYTNILTGNYYGHKFVPTEQNVKYYQRLYENDHKIREGYGPHGLAQLGGVLGVGAALATTGAYAPTIAGWTYRTALPWIAENLAVPTIVAESIDLAQNALFGTTSSETVSNFLQDNLHVPQPIADFAGEATNPGWYIPSSYGVKLWNGAERLVTKGYNKFINPYLITEPLEKVSYLGLLRTGKTQAPVYGNSRYTTNKLGVDVTDPSVNIYKTYWKFKKKVNKDPIVENVMKGHTPANFTDSQWDSYYQYALNSRNKTLPYTVRDKHFEVKSHQQPETFYHGSPSSGFAIFDSSVSNNSNGALTVSGDKGIFLSSDNGVASGYAPASGPSYLYNKVPKEIQKVLDKQLRQGKITYQEYYNKLEEYAHPSDYGTVNLKDMHTMQKPIVQLPLKYQHSGVYPLYVKRGNTFTVDFEGNYWNNSPLKLDPNLYPSNSNGIVQYATNQGYDTVRLNNIIDTASGDPIVADDLIPLRSSQVKLATPITYDIEGKVIPLSQRDNFKNPDIRYKKGGIIKNKNEKIN